MLVKYVKACEAPVDLRCFKSRKVPRRQIPLNIFRLPLAFSSVVCLCLCLCLCLRPRLRLRLRLSLSLSLGRVLFS